MQVAAPHAANCAGVLTGVIFGALFVPNLRYEYLEACIIWALSLELLIVAFVFPLAVYGRLPPGGCLEMDTSATF